LGVGGDAGLKVVVGVVDRLEQADSTRGSRWASLRL
jgi:hypothetical protein